MNNKRWRDARRKSGDCFIHQPEKVTGDCWSAEDWKRWWCRRLRPSSNPRIHVQLHVFSEPTRDLWGIQPWQEMLPDCCASRLPGHNADKFSRFVTTPRRTGVPKTPTIRWKTDERTAGEQPASIHPSSWKWLQMWKFLFNWNIGQHSAPKTSHANANDRAFKNPKSEIYIWKKGILVSVFSSRSGLIATCSIPDPQSSKTREATREPTPRSPSAGAACL